MIIKEKNILQADLLLRDLTKEIRSISTEEIKRKTKKEEETITEEERVVVNLHKEIDTTEREETEEIIEMEVNMKVNKIEIINLIENQKEAIEEEAINTQAEAEVIVKNPTRTSI